MGTVQSIYGPKKNAAFNLYVPLFVAGTPAIKTTPTIAAGDIQISLDGGAFADPATLPAETPAGGGAVLVGLTGAEMNADVVVVRGVDQSGGEWDDWLVTIYTRAVTADELVRSSTPANALAVDAGGKVGVSSLAADTITANSIQDDAINSNKIATDAIGADQLAADAVTEIRDSMLDDGTRFSGAKIDAAISSRADGSAYTGPRAAKLDQLDAAISSRADGADWTPSRAVKLDHLDADVSSRADAASYTALRAAKLDQLDAAVSSRAAPGAQMALVDNALDAAKITAAAGNKLADHTIRRNAASARASANGDALTKRSLLGATSRLVNKIDTSTGQLLIFDETDGGTPFMKFDLIGDSSSTPIKTATPAA